MTNARGLTDRRKLPGCPGLHRRGFMIACVLFPVFASFPSAAQEQIEWKQTLNTAKALNMPQGVRADILGIELGETYAEVRPKLQRLLPDTPQAPEPKKSFSERMTSEMMGESSVPFEGIKESKSILSLRAPNGIISASYVGEIVVRCSMPGSTKDKIKEIIKVQFSAPSSGQQVIGIERKVSYPNRSDEPLAADIRAGLKAKFGAEPIPTAINEYGINFDNGQVYVPPPNASSADCRLQYDPGGTAMSQFVPRINANGRCDVVVRFAYIAGISQDHVLNFTMTLSDNERAKANLTADMAFLDAYVQEVQSRKGTAPKL